MNRFKKSLILISLDYILIVSSILLSLAIRLGEFYVIENDFIMFVLLSPLIAIPVFIKSGLYSNIVRYIGVNFVWSSFLSVSIFSLIWGLLFLWIDFYNLPRSLILINWILLTFSIISLRLFVYWLYSFDKKSNKGVRKNVLIYGAGQAGVQIISALEHSSNFLPVAFIDDKATLHGEYIKGYRVFHPKSAESLIRKYSINEIIIAIPSATKKTIQSIINSFYELPINIKVLPGLNDLVNGKVQVSDIRKVEITDLLGREVIPPNKDLLAKNIANKTVMVTGAGGSIGSELCRQILSLNPKRLILLDSSELALYNIERELRPQVDKDNFLIPILGNVTNKKRVHRILQKFKVNTIYHAAAYKHVPLVELNNSEGIFNNIFGTLYCAQAAEACGVENFVLISTDKAVRPTNAMGASKRVSELILQAISIGSNTSFTMVRFGNVLGSSGSVIPLFQEQIRHGGPLTVTHKSITRYFMTIKEAVELVIQAGTMSSEGGIYILDMGKPVKIYDLAMNMIRLSGLRIKDDKNLNGDIEIKFTGLRPGEKLYEELLICGNTDKTSHPLIMKASEDYLIWKELSIKLQELEVAATEGNEEKVREILLFLVPGYSPKGKIKDILY